VQTKSSLERGIPPGLPEKETGDQAEKDRELTKGKKGTSSHLIQMERGQNPQGNKGQFQSDETKLEGGEHQTQVESMEREKNVEILRTKARLEDEQQARKKIQTFRSQERGENCRRRKRSRRDCVKNKETSAFMLQKKSDGQCRKGGKQGVVGS